MSNIVKGDFDYGDLVAEKVLECETAFRAACAIEDQATRMIGEQLAKVKENLKFLRNGAGWIEWCRTKLKISHTQAQNYINEFENGESLKNFSTFGKSARWLLVAPNTPQEVRERADALAEAGEDISIKAIKQLKADYEAEREARGIAERRAEEFRQESNERRKKIRELESQTGERIIEKEVIPPDYEAAKQKAAALEGELKTLKADQQKIVDSQVQAKLRGYQSELDELDRKKAQLDDMVARKQAYMESLSSDVKRIETHRSVIDGIRLELIGLAAFLNDMEDMRDLDTIRRWQALGCMLQEAKTGIDALFPAKPRLEVINHV